MKTIQKLLIAVVLLACATIYACQKQKGVEPAPPTASVSSSQNKAVPANGKLFSWHPDGTKVEKTENGFIETAPEGWAYAGLDSKGNPINIANKSQTISCTCNNASGQCRPFYSTSPWGPFSGCGGTCTNCTIKKSTQLHDQPVYFIKTGHLISGQSGRRMNSQVSHKSSFPLNQYN